MKIDRKIDKMIVHCSATPPDMDIGAEDIRVWHMDRGWSDIGYHLVVRRYGTLELGRDFELIGAHTKGYNTGSIGVCLVGGLNENNKPENNFTDEQFKTLSNTIRIFRADYKNMTIHGHNEFSNKACPSFDVQEWLRKENI